LCPLRRTCVCVSGVALEEDSCSLLHGYHDVPCVCSIRRREGELGPTVNTTGLGLPLSRALAVAGGGWLSLDEVCHSHPGPGPRVEVDTAESAGCTSDDDVDLTTMYW
jgi:hypothetical protein